ncbi:MAG: alcohol dehydrogenase catalytic domain-containing protein, partial [Glutamicibacter sp.]
MRQIHAAVLERRENQRPYAKHRPLAMRQLQLEEPGPGEVLVRITAAGLCHSDLSVIDGNRPRPLPMVLGHESAGIVEQ